MHANINTLCEGNGAAKKKHNATTIHRNIGWLNMVNGMHRMQSQWSCADRKQLYGHGAASACELGVGWQRMMISARHYKCRAITPSRHLNPDRDHTRTRTQVLC